MENKNDEVEILDIDEIQDENLNPDGIEVNLDMINEDLELQANGTEEDLVQDNFNTDTIEELMGEGSVVENVHTIN